MTDIDEVKVVLPENVSKKHTAEILHIASLCMNAIIDIARDKQFTPIDVNVVLLATVSMTLQVQRKALQMHNTDVVWLMETLIRDVRRSMALSLPDAASPEPLRNKPSSTYH